MKHCFVVNPSAGKGKPVKLIPEIETICKQRSLDFEIYQTEGKSDAISFVKRCTSRGEDTRVYAVGGDGTLNDVLNGIEDFDKTVLVSVPCGTGNDFVKTLNTSHADALDINAAIDSAPIQIDYLNVAQKRCINICNVGLDSIACYYMQQFKKLPLMKGSLPYIFGVLKSLFGDPSYKLKLTLDGESFEGCFMLGAFANGQYYGGAFRAAPLADLQDGLIDVCLVNKVSKMRVINWIGEYKRGEHITSPHFKDILTYRKAGRITVECENPMQVCFDGELLSMKRFDISLVKKGIAFAAAGAHITR